MGLILCNGYVTERQFLKNKTLIMNAFLCNGYVTVSPFYQKFLCDCHVTGSHFRAKILFDGYLAEPGLSSVLSPYQARYHDNPVIL